MTSEEINKNMEVNQQYQPIVDLIDELPEKTVSSPSGIDYGSNSWALKIHLLRVISHCKNMKRIGVEFEPPFTKSELQEKLEPPYTREKIEWSKSLQDKYAKLDDQAYAQDKGVTAWQAIA